MNPDNDHNKQDAWLKEQEKLFEQLESPFAQDKKELWEQLEAQTINSSPPSVIRSIPWFRIAAAVLVLVVCSTAFCKLYTIQVNCPNSQHLSHQLPDGSLILLNAASNISYAPYWWSIDRKVTLEGEAFFEVKKGSKFKVASNLGSTTVLGTSFNIFARANTYQVSCLTGKVKVSSNSSNQQVTLHPQEFVSFSKSKPLQKISLPQNGLQHTWKNNVFNFNDVPLINVFEEIERQYDIKVICNKLPTSNYIGSFEKSKDITTTLNLICLPFNLKFEKTGNKNYHITPQ